jgi:predicted sulfurtransferase
MGKHADTSALARRLERAQRRGENERVAFLEKKLAKRRAEEDQEREREREAAAKLEKKSEGKKDDSKRAKKTKKTKKSKKSKKSKKEKSAKKQTGKKRRKPESDEEEEADVYGADDPTRRLREYLLHNPEAVPGDLHGDAKRRRLDSESESAATAVWGDEAAKKPDISAVGVVSTYVTVSASADTPMEESTKTEAPAAGPKNDKACRFYLRGVCTRGNACSFAHPEGQEGSAALSAAASGASGYVALRDGQTLTDMQLREQRALKNTTLVLFYQYVEPEWTPEEHEYAIQYAREAGQRNGMTGRCRTAREGFNGTMTGSAEGVRAWCEEMRQFQQLDGRYPCAHTDFKLTDGLPNGQAFPTLNVFPVVELVNYGLAGRQAPRLIADGVGTALHLSPEEYHKQMEDKDTVIIDVRNFYEVDIGRFQPPPGGAKFIDPNWRKSTEFPAWIENPETVQQLEGKTVMMYCTGGIRCERASAHVREVIGDKIKGLVQCKGGIERYLKAFPEDGGYWVGKNYVFDKRFLHGPANKANHEVEVISKCANPDCDTPCDRYRNKKRCAACRVPLLVCMDCQKKKLDKKLKLRCRLCVAENVLPGQFEGYVEHQAARNRNARSQSQQKEFAFDYGQEEC